MSGSEVTPNTVDREQILFDFENFTVHPATYTIKDTDTREDGYAVVYKEDDVVQLYSPNVVNAIQAAVQGDQTLQFVAALEEQKELAENTEGLLGDAIDFSDELPGDGDLIN